MADSATCTRVSRASLLEALCDRLREPSLAAQVLPPSVAPRWVPTRRSATSPAHNERHDPPSLPESSPFADPDLLRRIVSGLLAHMNNAVSQPRETCQPCQPDSEKDATTTAHAPPAALRFPSTLLFLRNLQDIVTGLPALFNKPGARPQNLKQLAHVPTAIHNLICHTREADTNEEWVTAGWDPNTCARSLSVSSDRKQVHARVRRVCTWSNVPARAMCLPGASLFARPRVCRFVRWFALVAWCATVLATLLLT